MALPVFMASQRCRVTPVLHIFKLCNPRKPLCHDGFCVFLKNAITLVLYVPILRFRLRISARRFDSSLLFLKT